MFMARKMLKYFGPLLSTLRKSHMLQTIATVPTPRMIELLELIETANRNDAEPRLRDYLHHCRRTGYEPPDELLQLAREHIRRKQTC
jgi:hypothetical protein